MPAGDLGYVCVGVALVGVAAGAVAKLRVQRSSSSITTSCPDLPVPCQTVCRLSGTDLGAPYDYLVCRDGQCGCCCDCDTDDFTFGDRCKSEVPTTHHTVPSLATVVTPGPPKDDVPPPTPGLDSLIQQCLPSFAHNYNEIAGECTPTQCGRFCFDFSRLFTYTGSDQDLLKIITYCARLIFRNNRHLCSRFGPFQSAQTYCMDPENNRTCSTICQIATIVEPERRVFPPECNNVVDVFCMVYNNFSRRCGERAERRLVSNILQQYNSLSVGEVVRAFNTIYASINARNGTLNDTIVNDMVEILDGIILRNFGQHGQQSDNDSFALLDGMNQITSQLASEFLDGSRNDTFRHMSRSLVFQVGRYGRSTRAGESFKFPAMEMLNTSVDASIKIPYSVLCGDTEDCEVIVAISILKNFTQHVQESVNRFTNSSEEPVSVLLTALVFESQDLQSRLKRQPVEMYFHNLNPITNTTEMKQYQCVFLDEQNLKWSKNGLTTKNYTDDSLSIDDEPIPEGTVKCTSTHLTSFAVLLSVTGADAETEAERRALSVVSYVGCGISIVCLTATIIILLALRKKLKKGPLLYIHLNLAISLLLAMILFVGGIETATAIPILCTVIAAVLQYLFLCVFCWMLSEGIMLYLLVVRVFGNMAKRWYLLLLLGWGLPVPIVAISSGILWREYGSEEFCWIEASVSGRAIWSFVGPVIVVILINTAILVLTIRAILRGKKLGGAEHQVSNMDLAKTGVKSSIVLLPLLGLTWVFGLFAVNSSVTVFAWLFTVFNSLQGLFIFLLHVARNKVVVKSVLTCCGRVKTSSTKTKSSTMSDPSRERTFSNFSTMTIDVKPVSKFKEIRNPIFSDKDEVSELEVTTDQC